MSKTTILYQHGTLALLVPGLFRGTMRMGDLLTHGDTGIGTGEGLDGELLILDGTPYQVTSDGVVHVVDDEFLLPFASVHHAAFKPLMTVEDVSADDLEALILEQGHFANTFFAVTVKGTFTCMTTRAVARNMAPDATLASAAENQSQFVADHVSGTLLSYYSPELFNGAAVGGFHAHFLTEDQSMGGHVLQYDVEKADVAIQLFDTLEQHLPTSDPDFMAHDFSNDDVNGVIKKAE
ncbi:acetolactate decarboxylase [Levilactobacillus bambusae]|uniref:Alpha-acetolactate decarboxylase n=1 Tax=Levilactobacillus bambusae TaxID=2024736 RepID=A0A2V1MXP3_9LACO|nr:acetolactate decarboxylase [Levilactobacillus bambusae]PWF99813.1 acetolactate decarboxylase [Levilactobacillus bambusae]